MTLHPRFTARLVIWHALARRAVQTSAPRIARARGAWQRVQPWFAGASLVFAYLFAQQWMATKDLEQELRVSHVANVELDFENARLEDRIAEDSATRAVPLVYVIEAGSTLQARDKLARIALMVATRADELRQSEKRP